MIKRRNKYPPVSIVFHDEVLDDVDSFPLKGQIQLFEFVVLVRFHSMILRGRYEDEDEDDDDEENTPASPSPLSSAWRMAKSRSGPMCPCTFKSIKLRKTRRV